MLLYLKSSHIKRWLLTFLRARRPAVPRRGARAGQNLYFIDSMTLRGAPNMPEPPASAA